ncbi:MAG: type 2 lanthipeptide synthetase LanM family protein [Gemmatimonadaceae bacterium]
MALSIERLATIVAHAATLAERLGTEAIVSEPLDGIAVDDSFSDVGPLVAKWRAAVAGDDEARWARRLAWDGYDEARVRHSLATRRSFTTMPEWASLLRDVSRVAQSRSSDDLDAARRAQLGRRAFGDLLMPFVVVARQRVAAVRLRAGALMSDGAHASLDEGLMALLSGLGVRTLYQEFQKMRSAEGGGPLSVLRSALGKGSRRHYDAFIHRHHADGFETLFAEYPVLGRLLATRTLFWVANTTALIERLIGDHAAIRATFANGGDPGPITRIETNLSDCHRGATTVATMHFDGGLTIVYKPRSLAVDRCFYRLLDFLNVRHGGLPLRGLSMIEGDDYGWVEFAVTAPCDSLEEVDHYFERGGMLLALSYVLGASDLHSANVLACGEHPTLIDLEVVFNPLVDNGVPIERSGRRHTHDTVLSTALIPSRSTSGAVDFLDGGLLDRTSKQVYRRETLRFANTDMMSWGHFEFIGGGRDNVPTRDGVPARTKDHLGALRRGFERMYDTLAAHRADLLAAGGPLRAFEEATVRVVHRPTSIYDHLSLRTLHPRYMRRGTERSIEFERLNVGTLVQKTRPALWSVFGAEQRELEQGDIPVFYTHPGTRTLWSGGGDFADDTLMESGLEGVAARLRALGPEDRAQQLDLIRVSFAGADDYVTRLSERDAPAPDDTDEEAIAEATRVGEALLRLRREGPEGSWIGLVGKESLTTRLQPLDAGLFDGVAGIALFLGALASCTQSQEFRDAAEGSLRPIRRALRDARGNRALVERIGIGGAYGVGGLVYVFTRLARFLDDASYLVDARAAAAAISEDQIARDTRLDVMFGSSGALLSLLALYDATGDVVVRNQAIRCGEHLLEHQLDASNMHAGHWVTGYGAPETGFAHGTAGIVLALSRLMQVERIEGGAQGMALGLRALDASFDAALDNWHDVVAHTPEAKSMPWSSWCRGAAGIGMAHLAMRDEGQLASDAQIDAACRNVIARDFPSKDHLCCGTSGRIDFLLSAARRLGRADLHAAAREKSMRIRRERVARGSYSTGYVTELSPGFFQGIAGVGYGMLRVARPDSIPSVLLWE